ncbi:hypothetical protein [Butyricimonas sp.]|uniref:hypothetical protein n=1 Tax=Butyricimonas sp. TaxID=1969738 RepID=UPI0025C02825|nr:hypothetical protein [Butyricimonas sp.]
MKKRLLLCFSLVAFMLISFVRCSQEPLDVDDNLGIFAREARLYFEQNASDIQTVRVGIQEENLSRSMALSSRVITPNWQEGQSVKHRAISSLEVPLTGDVYVKSFYSRVQDGKRQRSFSNVQTKLIIQKHDELKEMRSFVVTIITDKRYEIMHAQSSQTCSFLNPKDFSGLMIVSDLEGNYLDAFQFTDGKQQRVALASASEEKDINADGAVSTFALMDANSAGMYSRSGEGGGGGWVPVPPGELPEVEVWPNCPTCHLPINRCPGHNTPPSPPVNPGWTCPICGSSVCPGHTGGGTGGGTTPSTVKPQGNLSKKAFSDDSKLTPEQWKNVEDMLNKINNDCMGGKLIGNLDGSIKLTYDSGLNNPKYNHGTNTLKMNNFNSESSATLASFLHELIHSQQTDNFSSRLNLEIEAHLATYRYALRHNLNLASSTILTAMGELDLYLDGHYNTASGFSDTYEFAIDLMRQEPTYNAKDYPENSSARNFSTVQKLSVDCKK